MCLALLFCQLSPVGDVNGFSNNFCNVNTNGFPSPCGVWVVSYQGASCATGDQGFPSPCGVWVVSPDRLLHAQAGGFRPPAGCGLFPMILKYWRWCNGFRPLAGCGLFLQRHHPDYSKPTFPSPCGVWVVSVRTMAYNCGQEFPSPCGVWVVSQGENHGADISLVSVPLRGVGCFGNWCS